MKKKGLENSKLSSLVKDEKKSLSEMENTSKVQDTTMATNLGLAREQKLAKTTEKKEPHEDRSQSQLGGFNLSNTNVNSSTVSQSQTKPRSAHIEDRRFNHHPQVLDEDTERFKIRLDELVNKFKFETLTEFMTVKKHLLDEQNSAISQEKMIGDSRYQSKCFEVISSKAAS